MERDSNQSALNLIYDWALTVSPWFASVGFALDIKDPVSGSMQITLESKTRFIDICASNNAYGLDIQVFAGKCQQPVYLVTGACENPAVFMERLNDLIQWVKTNKG